MLTKREPNTPLDVLDVQYQPKELRCKDCGGKFEYTVEEQRYFAAKSYQPPIRCHGCRAERKRERDPRVQVVRYEG
jgi:hypothetical protein